MKNANEMDSNISQVLGVDGSSARKKHRKVWILVAIAIAVIVLVIGLPRLHGKEQQMQFRTVQAEQGDLTVLVTATGTLEPTNEVEVGSELSGRLDSVEVDYNSKVVVDQVLAKLDTSKLQAQATQSKAALETAQANVQQAQATLKETESKLAQYKKVRQLSDNKVPSQLEYDAAEASYERAQADLMSAKAAVSQAQATLDIIETDLSKAVIRSPINGVVLTRNVEKGQTVAASFETPVLFTIAEDLTEMELHVNVDEADIGKVKDGQKATFTVDAYPDRTFDAEITEIRYGAETVDGVVTYETVLKVNNTDLSLRPGMTATADIVVLNVENTLMVSNSALRFKMPTETQGKNNRGILSSILPHPPRGEGKQVEQNTVNPGEHTVWVLKDGMPESITVTTGVTDGVKTQITGGELKPGMQLIVGTITQGM